MAKSEVFVIAFKEGNDSVKYAGLDARDSFVKNENPSALKKCFNKEQAVSLAKALKTKGLGEGVSIRVKSIAQAVRDYSWAVLQAVNETTIVDEDTMSKVLKRYETKKKEETPAAEPEQAPAEVETPTETEE